MSGRGSRDKGKRGEREVATILREAMPAATIHRGWQARAGSDAPDVIAPGLWCECKRSKKPNIRAALRQAHEANGDRPLVPIACTRADRDGWLVTLKLSDFANMAAKLWALGMLGGDE